MSPESKIEIYGQSNCPGCKDAKNLLHSKKLGFIEYNIQNDASRKAELFEKIPGVRSVPQIFVDGKHVGGFAELKAALG
jgi:glutaredoxin 3